MSLLNWTRREILQTGLAATFLPVSAKFAWGRPQPSAKFAGINLAGAEFGDTFPGVYGRDYVYPSLQLIEYYRGLGFNLIRLPFRWERLQPDLGKPFSEAEQKHLSGLGSYLDHRRTKLVLDPHNFARRKLATDGWRNDYLIGSAEVPITAFVDFWSRLASLFRTNGSVIFGLMNEPFGIPAATWLDITNTVIAAIRSQGASNLILVPGVAYTGAHSWISAGNGIFAGVKDPASNYAFDVHQYLDEDSSGTHPEAVSPTIGSERIRAFEAWARQHRVRAFLGEFGASSDKKSLQALTDLCRSLAASPDVWLGSSAWAGGPWWPRDYMFNLDPQGGEDRPQTRILASFAKKLAGS